MNKQDLHQHCLKQLSDQTKALEAAARKTASIATDDEHKARSKYETFSLENSYLARGQARRVEEMRTALAAIRAMKVTTLPEDAEVQMGALMEVADERGETELLWMVPAGGGEEIHMPDQVVLMLTPNSPLSKALLKKRAGASVTFSGRTLRIRSVQ